MARIDVLGGDFAKGMGAFDTTSGFLLYDRDGNWESIPLCRLQLADHASDVSLRMFGAGESMLSDLAVAESQAAGGRVFIAVFDDGRLLLASTDKASFEQICAPRSM